MSDTTEATATSTAAPDKVLLSPPWWTYQKTLKYTVGQTPGVKVGPLISGTTGYICDVVVQQSASQVVPSRGTALATVVAGVKTYGNVSVQVRVVDPQGNPYAAEIVSDPQQVVTALHAGLAGNPMFSKAFVGRTFSGSKEVAAEFTASVVQFWNDNLADVYGNTNLVAATAFKSVLVSSYGTIQVVTTTVNEGHK